MYIIINNFFLLSNSKNKMEWYNKILTYLIKNFVLHIGYKNLIFITKHILRNDLLKNYLNQG